MEREKFSFRLCTTIRYSILPILIFGSSVNLFSQKGAFEKLQLDFLEGDEVLGISNMVQDQQGLIWLSVSGNGGLLRYNGYESKKYMHNPGDSTSLLSNGVEKLYVDQQGILWLTNDFGVSRYDPEIDAFHHYKFEENPFFSESALKMTVAQGMAEDPKGRLWMIMQGGRLYEYDRINDHFISHLDDPSDSNNLLEDLLRILVADHKGNLWLGTGYGAPENGTGLIKYNPETGQTTRFIHIPGDTTSLIDNRVSAILEDKDGKIWIGTYKSGLHLYDDLRGNFVRVNNLPPGSTPQSTQVDGMQVWSNDIFIQILAQDQKGNFWVSTSGLGIHKFDPHSGETTTYTPATDLAAGQDIIWSFMEDRSGNIWLGYLHFEGIYKMDQYDMGIHLNSELRVVQRSCESREQDGFFWFSTMGTGLFFYDINRGIVKSFKYDPADPKSIGSNNVRSVFEDEDGTIWVGLGGWNTRYKTDEHLGLAKLDKVSGTFTRYHIPDKHSPQYSCPINFIADDQKGNLWLDGGSGGLYKFNKETETVVRVKLPQAEDATLALFNNSDKNHLFISDRTNKITYKYEVEKDKFWPFIEGYRCTKIMEDTNGWYWIGTEESGLLHYHPEKDSLIQFTYSDGLPSNEWLNFLKDDSGYLWISCRGGMVRFNPQNEEFVSDGLPRGQPFWNALKSRNGRFLFGFAEGLYSFFPEEMKGNPFPPEINITGVDISGEAYPISKTDDLTLNYVQNNLTFHYLATHYSNPQKNKYKYRLLPFEQKWNDSGNQRSARYTNLNPGKYTFELSGSNSNGVWSNETEKLSFLIHPPWWRTTYAYILFSLSGLGMILFVTFRYQNKMRAKQLQLENKQRHLEANRRFVPQDFLQILGKESILELKLGDQIQVKMTVLFADIRSYTSLAETMNPEETFRFINEFLGRMGPIIQGNGGFINQYYGDGIMALFKDHHHLAIKAAIEMQKDIQVFNKERLWQKKPAIKIGIGLNTGQLMLGVIGDENRYDSSVISDTVNTASRVEGLTKLFGSSVIISEKTLSELWIENNDELDLSNPSLLYRFLGKIQVKGKSEILKIYDLFDGDHKKVVQEKLASKEDFEKALDLFFNSKFGSAADQLKILRQKYPDDKAIQYYFERAVHYSIEGVKEGWNGVEEMQFK